jgi:hypothetical protein
MDPQQELFTALKLALEAKGFDVYDGVLPPENTPYPFVYLGDFRQTDTEHKNAVTGIVYPVIHVWHNNCRQRGTVSAMLLEIKTECRKLVKTSNFAWLVRNVTGRIIPDNTTKTPLLHGVIEAEFLFS